MIEIHENGLNMIFDTDGDGELYLLHFGENEFDKSLITDKDIHVYRALEVQTTGNARKYHHAMKNIGTDCGGTLRYISHKDYRNCGGRKLEFILSNDSISAALHYQFFDGIKAVQCWTEVTNLADEPAGLEYISLFSLGGLDKEGETPLNDRMELRVCVNTWAGELSWRKYTLEELGYSRIRDMQLRTIELSSNGAWSTNGYLPMGYIRNRDADHGVLWQIENNGAWQWEIGDLADRLYLKLSGPNEVCHHFWKSLKKGESFTTCRCAVIASRGGFEEAVREITKYRRAIVRRNTADSSLPVIFNDYMKCMLCNASEKKLLPVIDRAAELGAEYFMMDAGWYSQSDWETDSGEWRVNPERFPNGIKAVCGYIYKKGMKPGIWFEPEVVGINSPRLNELPDRCFFMRHGKRIPDYKRYMLDYRQREVTEYMDAVIDKFVTEYGIRYLKFDFNLEPGIGTEVDADSFGDGLLSSWRAYKAWIAGILDRYPDVIIENCASGGLRMNYDILDLLSVQSVTDQEDYRLNGVIASNTATGILPEQAGYWIYPSADADKYEIAYNMVNAMLHRMHVSGAVTQIGAEGLELMRSGISYYKSIREQIPDFMPFYPLGNSGFYDNWLAEGYTAGDKCYIAVWCREGGEADIFLPLDFQLKSVGITYPSFEDNSVGIVKGGITVHIGHINSACVIEGRIMP